MCRGAEYTSHTTRVCVVHTACRVCVVLLTGERSWPSQALPSASCPEKHPHSKHETLERSKTEARNDAWILRFFYEVLDADRFGDQLRDLKVRKAKAVS